MEALRSILYAIGQSKDVQRGKMEHFKHDYDLVNTIVTSECIDKDDIDAMASIYERDLFEGNYDGAADDWDANRIRYCGKILREIALD